MSLLEHFSACDLSGHQWAGGTIYAERPRRPSEPLVIHQRCKRCGAERSRQIVTQKVRDETEPA